MQSPPKGPAPAGVAGAHSRCRTLEAPPGLNGRAAGPGPRRAVSSLPPASESAPASKDWARRGVERLDGGALPGATAAARMTSSSTDLQRVDENPLMTLKGVIGR